MTIPETVVRKVISLAKAANQANEQYLDKFFSDGIISFGVDRHEDSPEYKDYKQKNMELYEFVESLEYPYILDLEALMSLGRGDGGTFESARQYFGSSFPDASQSSSAVGYLTSKSPLGEYLEEALHITGIK